MMNEYPRETVEFQPVAVTLNATPVTTGVTFAVVAYGTRPVTFSAPTTIGAEIGVMVQALAPGIWAVWAKVTSAPETPVILAGEFKVS